MLKFKYLGISALPRAGYRMAEECIGVSRADCGEGTYQPPECDPCTTTLDKDKCDECTHHTERPDRYAGSFPADAVAQLRQQLDDRMGQPLGY